MSATMDIRLSIERLILDGIQLDRRQQRQLQTALHHELVRLLAAGGQLDSARATDPNYWRHIPPIQLAEPGDASRLGVQVAQVIYGGLVPNAASSHRRGSER